LANSAEINAGAWAATAELKASFSEPPN
jgi:hypothetical protein